MSKKQSPAGKKRAQESEVKSVAGAAGAPKISVLVPIFNVERYLHQCLTSLAEQTFQDFEVLCLDDGSTDSSPQIIDEYVAKDPRFRRISKPNSGYGDTMNRGLAEATGQYIAILESDDFADPDFLEFMYEGATSKNLDIYKSNFWFYWSKPTPERMNLENLYYDALEDLPLVDEVFDPITVPPVYWVKPSIWSAIYRRQYLLDNKINFLPTPGASFQDTSFTFKVLSCSPRMAITKRAFVHYRQDNEQSSVNSPGKVFCICDENAEMLRFLDEDRPDLSPAYDCVRAKVKYYGYIWNLRRLAPNLRPKFFKRMSKEFLAEFSRGSLLNTYTAEMNQVALSPSQIRDASEIAFSPKYALVKLLNGGKGKMRLVRACYESGGLPYCKQLVKDKVFRVVGSKREWK